MEVLLNHDRLFGSVEVESPANLTHATIFGHCTVGAFTYFNADCEITNVDIGRYCSIGQGVIINPGHHPLDFLTTHPIACDPVGTSSGMQDLPAYRAVGSSPSRPVSDKGQRVRIGHDVWIGARAIVLQGVEIGNGAVVGAGAVVTKNVKPFEIVGGVPAKRLRLRFSPWLRQRVGESLWWGHDLSRLNSRDFSDVRALLKELKTNPPPLLAPEKITVAAPTSR